MLKFYIFSVIITFILMLLAEKRVKEYKKKCKSNYKYNTSKAVSTIRSIVCCITPLFNLICMFIYAYLVMADDSTIEENIKSEVEKGNLIEVID